MKIDKIEICNLASIEGEQVIDFTQEPLKSAGLFAITGNTGAGKSTVLDAICLALYNEAPRLGNRENTSRTAEDTPNIFSTCNILRRGTTEGYSKVTFSLSDNTQYEATWSVGINRNGKFRKVQRELKQLKPKYATLADKSKEVQALLLQILKLDYSQFTRTVILAQNSFTNFLSAKRGEKSQLLEKITGTEIYAEISRRIFLETKEAEKQFIGATQHMEGLSKGTLIVEDLQRARDNMNLQQSLQTKFDNEKTLLARKLEWYDEHDKAMADLDEKKKQLHDAQQAFNAMYDQQRELVRYDSLQPFAPTYMEIKRVQKDIDQYKGDTSAREQLVEQIKRDVDDSQGKHNEAQARLLNARQILYIQQPNIDRGRNIEGQMASTARTLTDTQNELAALDDEISQRNDARSSKNAELKDCEKRLANAKLDLQTMIQHHQMVSQIELIRTRLEKMNEIRLSILETENNLHESQKVLQLFNNNKAELEKAWRQLQETNSRLTAELLIHEQANKGLNSGEIQLRLNKLVSQAMRSGDAITLWKRIDELYNEISEKTDELRRRNSLNKNKDTDITALQVKILGLKETYEMIHRTYTLSQSVDIKNLRQELKEGSPCPLCGSTHHPYHSDSELQLDQLFEALTEQHQKAQDELAAAQAMLSELQKEYSDEQGQLNVEEQQLKRFIRTQSENVEAWKAFADLDPSFKQCDENVNRHNRHTILHQIHDSSCRERDEVSQQLIDFNRHQDEINRINAEIQTTQQQITENTRLSAQADAACKVEESKIADMQQNIERNKNILAEEMALIDSKITVSNWKERWRNSYEAFDRELQAIKTKWESCNAAVQEEERSLFRLQQEFKALAKNLEDMQISRQGLANKSDNLQQQINKFKEELRTLFGNSTVDDEDRRLKKAVEDASDEVQAAQAVYASANERLVKLNSEIESLRNQCAKYEKELQELRTNLDLDISRFNSGENSPLQYFELDKYFINPQDWAKLRATIDDLKTKLDAISFKVDAANQIVLNLDQSPFRPSDNDPDDNKHALIAKQEELANSIKENQKELQKNEFLVRTHNDCLRKMDEYKPVLTEAESNYSSWKKLCDVLGSAEGKAFREIAQCYTFEFLVDFANHQLADLTPRYRLQNRPGTLQLEVIDRHMLDQIRAVNSLSGGESFIVSLSLALGLSSLSSNNLDIGSLFIDEGFGNLDAHNLNLVIDALSNLQNTQRRKVGVISHTEQIQNRISPKIHLLPEPGGRSKITIQG